MHRIIILRDRLFYNGLTGEATRRYCGVVAVGNEGRELAAAFVRSDTRAVYIAEQRSAARVLPWIDGVFIGIGLLMRLIELLVALRVR